MRTPYDRVHERYRNDQTFHAVVDCLYKQILDLELTPSEVREAAMFACLLMEEQRNGAIVVSWESRTLIDGAGNSYKMVPIAPLERK